MAGHCEEVMGDSAVVVVVERRPGLVAFAGSIAGEVADTRRVVAVTS